MTLLTTYHCSKLYVGKGGSLKPTLPQSKLPGGMTGREGGENGWGWEKSRRKPVCENKIQTKLEETSRPKKDTNGSGIVAHTWSRHSKDRGRRIPSTHTHMRTLTHWRERGGKDKEVLRSAAWSPRSHRQGWLRWLPSGPGAEGSRHWRAQSPQANLPSPHTPVYGLPHPRQRQYHLPCHSSTENKLPAHFASFC